MRTLQYIMLAGIVLLASCNKEPIHEHSHEGLIETTFRIQTDASAIVDTRAEASGTGNDDFIDRIDVYEYDNTGSMTEHFVFEDSEGIDLSQIEIKRYYTYHDYHHYFFLANLSEAQAEYFAGLNADQIHTSASGRIPLSCGNFNLHHWIMGGGMTASFEKDATLTITLFRYITKFEIGTITAAFDDPDMMNADVKVKTIAITNTPNVLRPLGRHPLNFYGGYQDVWNPGYSLPSNFSGTLFGGITGGPLSSNDLDDYSINYSGTFSLAAYGASGALAATFPYLYNNNRRLAAGVLNIDAPGDMRTATEIVIPDGSGVICSSSGSVNHVLTVNKQLYTHPQYRGSYSSLYATQWEYQDDTQKLVIETEIDGETMFYIISIRELMPNTVYRVNNINLRGLGSPYSNTYIKKFSATMNAVSIDGQNEIVISELNVGVKEDDSGLYNEY